MNRSVSSTNRLWCVPSVAELLRATNCYIPLPCLTIIHDYVQPGIDECVCFLKHVLTMVDVTDLNHTYMSDDVQIEFFASDALREQDTYWCNQPVPYTHMIVRVDIHVTSNDDEEEWTTYIRIRLRDVLTMWTWTERICQQLHRICSRFHNCLLQNVSIRNNSSVCMIELDCCYETA
jgi:hypothetical protein